jgi:hypothetical protein
MVESIFDKMAAEAVSKWVQPVLVVPVAQEKDKRLVVRPEYKVGGVYRKRL